MASSNLRRRIEIPDWLHEAIRTEAYKEGRTVADKTAQLVFLGLQQQRPEAAARIAAEHTEFQP
jgi:hypothetical protein